MAQGSDDAGARQAFVHLEAEQPQRRSDDARGAPLLERKLGMRMQVAAQGHETRHQVGDRISAWHRAHRRARPA